MTDILVKRIKFKDGKGKLHAMIVTYIKSESRTYRMIPKDWEEYLKVKRCENG